MAMQTLTVAQVMHVIHLQLGRPCLTDPDDWHLCFREIADNDLQQL